MFGSRAVHPHTQRHTMTDHILAEVEVAEPQSCYVTPHATGEWTVTDVSRSRLSGDDGEVVEEFTLAGDPDRAPPETNGDDGVERVFSYEDEHVFRVTRPASQGCVCEHVEQAGCVVRKITADESAVVVTFLAADTETLRRVISELKEVGERINLHRLVDSSTGGGPGDPALLDREVLTSRQEEVLEVAHGMGYFEHPREATAGEVADELGIATTTFTEHLAAAQRKLLDDLLAA